MLMALAAMIGWCGTKWPGWWRGPHPHPDPEPWWDIAYGVLGMIGGVAAVSIFDNAFAGFLPTAFLGGTFAATAVAAVMALGRKR